MADLSAFNSWEHTLNMLDDYAGARKEEIDARKLGKDTSLIKSYMLETHLQDNEIRNGNGLIQNLLLRTNWDLTPIDNSENYIASEAGELQGFVEVVSTRHIAFHTTLKTNIVDPQIRNLVKQSAQIDFVWLAGSFLDVLWQLLIREQLPERYVSFKFEHDARFEEFNWETYELETDEIDQVEEDEEVERTIERRASTLAVTSRVSKISQFLPNLQSVLSDFKAIKMLRFPASEMRGGYDFWDWGKVTYRSPSFRDGRDNLRSILDLYREVTQEIENRVWFEVEQAQFRSNSEHLSLIGTPVTFTFPEPLELTTFQNFVETTFAKGQGPFRFWGDPIKLSEKKFHVYGVDLHLWQRIYLELTPSRFIIVLPKGTCGNTVHRLTSNIQRYLSPDVETYIGSYPYKDLVRDVLLGQVGPQ